MKWNRSLPSGTKDKLFREANGSYQVEKKVNAILTKRGYQRIETPSIEFEDVFKQQPDDEKEFYRFFDKQSRLLVLRPDMTMPIGRVIATTGIKSPLKLSYSGKVFRFSDEMLGEQNELTQAGIELIGYSSLKAEIECISCGVKILEELQIPNFHFELGHAQLFRQIISILNLTEKEAAQLKLHFNRKNVSELRQFTAKHSSPLNEFICAIPRLFGSASEVFPKAYQLLPQDSAILETVKELEELMEWLRKIHPTISVTIDLGLVALMDYYTGVLFSGYADLIPEIFLRGGRYDSLVEQFGSEIVPAVGLGINLDILVALQYQLNTLAQLRQTTTLVHGSLEQATLLEKIVEENDTYQLSLFDTLEEAIVYGEKWQYKQVLEVTAAGIKKIEVGEVEWLN